MKYFAIIGDIVASRNEEQRGDVQKKLEAVLKDINEEFRSSIAADFLITLGDEFQGLLCDCPSADPIRIATTIIDKMHPVQIRVAIGRGTMSTEINRKQALGADGRAFHNARLGIQMIRAAERKARSSIHICTDDDVNDRALNMILRLAFTIRREWTRRQGSIARRYMELMFENGHPSQMAMAKEFGVTQSTVNISLTDSRAREYTAAILTARDFLAHMSSVEAAAQIMKEY